jgi:hypothetical protein
MLLRLWPGVPHSGRRAEFTDSCPEGRLPIGWDNLLGLIAIPTPTHQPVTVPASKVVMAGALVAGVPAAIANLFLGRCLIRGLMAGSVKG